MKEKFAAVYNSDIFRVLPNALENNKIEELRKKSFSDLLIERSFLQRSLMKKTRVLELIHQDSELIKNKNFINSIYHKIDQEERNSIENNLRIQEILIKSCSSDIDAEYMMDVKDEEDLDKIFRLFEKLNEEAMAYMENPKVQEIVIRANHALHFKSLRMMKFYLEFLRRLDKESKDKQCTSRRANLSTVKVMNHQKRREQLIQDITMLQFSIEDMEHIFISILPNTMELPQ